MKGDVFSPGDAIRARTVDASMRSYVTVDAIVLSIVPENNEIMLRKGPRQRLVCAIISPTTQQWTKAWWHAEDPDVRPNTSNDEIHAKWAAHVLRTGGGLLNDF